MPLTKLQEVIAQAVIDVMNNDLEMVEFYGIRTGKTFLFKYLDRYISSRPQNPSVEDFKQFIHNNLPQKK